MGYIIYKLVGYVIFVTDTAKCGVLFLEAIIFSYLIWEN